MRWDVVGTTHFFMPVVRTRHTHRHTTVTHRSTTHAVRLAFAPPCTRVTHEHRSPVCRARRPTAHYQRTSLRCALTIHHDCRAHRLLRDNPSRTSDVVRCLHLSLRAHTHSNAHPVRTGCNAARDDPSHRFARRSRIPRVVVHAPPYASVSRREWRLCSAGTHVVHTSFARDASGPEQKVYAVADTPAQNVYAGQQKAHGKHCIAG